MNLNRLFLCLLPVACCLLAVSCKPPLPVYFDQPIGTRVQGFDTIIAGNYVPLDDVIKKGMKEFSEKYKIGYDKIIRIGSAIEVSGKELNYDDLKELAGIDKKDSTKTPAKEIDCDSLFRALCNFNRLVSSELGDRIDKMVPSEPEAAMVKIAYDRVFFIAVDSAGNNMRDTLISLGPTVLLTKYSGKYFLNFRTENGWEILQMDVWENKFLSIRPFYFTGYNDCSKTIAELTVSTKNIYPDLKPIIRDKKLIGYKAALIPKLLLEKFKQSEGSMMLMRIK